jgi:hypothetical protein
MAGFEPTISSTPSWRIAKLSHILKQRPGGFEPPRPPWQGGRLPNYIMDALRVIWEGEAPAEPLGYGSAGASPSRLKTRKFRRLELNQYPPGFSGTLDLRAAPDCC